MALFSGWGTASKEKAKHHPECRAKIKIYDQSSFAPQMAIYLCDKQSYHHVPEGIATFDKTPG